MDIEGKNALVLGGAGLVGAAVCQGLLEASPARLVVAARRRSRAEQAVERLRAAFEQSTTKIIAVWGDVFLRAEWQIADAALRPALLADTGKRQRLIADILEPLDQDIADASLLVQVIEGRALSLGGEPADIVVDCMNTATAVSYQNVYTLAQRLADTQEDDADPETVNRDVETLLASLHIPQLVRHAQLLHEAMRRAGTTAYVKVGTTGTGGMGLNIPYTHGEEKPSRLLLSKAAVAGAQSLLTFLMARTPGGPEIVKEVKPAAVIGWREIAYGPVRSRGRDIPLFDCPPDKAVSVDRKENLVSEGEFGEPLDGKLEGVYVDTGENGQFSCAEFTAITALGQMQLVTPEEIAETVLREIKGGSTGRDIVAALDGAVMGPSYRGGFQRDAAVNLLRQLESEHGQSIAFENLGPPRLSKLLFEVELLRRVFGTIANVLACAPKKLSAAMEEHVCSDSGIRTRIISIGIPILLSDGARLLRGRQIKADNAHRGWVDLTPANMSVWRGRLTAIRDIAHADMAGDTSSRRDRNFSAGRAWASEDGAFDAGEIVAWIFNTEELGRRGKP